LEDEKGGRRVGRQGGGGSVTGSNSRRITSSSSEELKVSKMVLFALDLSSSSSCTRARRESERASERGREGEKGRETD
jgi:hypothetical protein